jgi:hypothetical protein
LAKLQKSWFDFLIRFLRANLCYEWKIKEMNWVFNLVTSPLWVHCCRSSFSHFKVGDEITTWNLWILCLLVAIQEFSKGVATGHSVQSIFNLQVSQTIYLNYKSV